MSSLLGVTSFATDVPELNAKFQLSEDKDEGYSLDLVYNADETGLNWKALPRKSLASKREKAAPGFKVSKERVTIMVAANATDGFTNEFIPDVKKYKKDNNKLGKVLLVIDNAPTHPDVEILNSIDEDFKVTYLPPNVTALLQPMDQGVIEKLKRMYKKQVLRRLLLADANEESVVQFAKKLNVKDCSYMIADSWSNMKESNLKNAWNKILEKTREKIEPKVTDQEDVDEFLELYGEIPGFSECDIQDTENWLTMDNDPGFQILNDEEIVSLVLAEDTTQHDSDEDCNTDTAESTKNRPSHEEALSAFNTAMSWLQKQEESCPTQLLLLKRLRDLAAKKRSSTQFSLSPGSHLVQVIHLLERLVEGRQVIVDVHSTLLKRWRYVPGVKIPLGPGSRKPKHLYTSRNKLSDDRWMSEDKC
ncbi:jerky protein homolog-like [Homalodisca vitripennis]|uniref:jerky protein homolog-like n=1 Tax=Homalodisca vitripennis TaxID=197043 RepID=UPI001EEADBDA|nr:jerky protein homolog-like [Homalodisca vitripennis]